MLLHVRLYPSLQVLDYLFRLNFTAAVVINQLDVGVQHGEQQLLLVGSSLYSFFSTAKKGKHKHMTPHTPSQPHPVAAPHGVVHSGGCRLCHRPLVPHLVLPTHPPHVRRDRLPGRQQHRLTQGEEDGEPAEHVGRVGGGVGGQQHARVEHRLKVAGKPVQLPSPVLGWAGERQREGARVVDGGVGVGVHKGEDGLRGGEHVVPLFVEGWMGGRGRGWWVDGLGV